MVAQSVDAIPSFFSLFFFSYRILDTQLINTVEVDELGTS